MRMMLIMLLPFACSTLAGKQPVVMEAKGRKRNTGLLYKKNQRKEQYKYNNSFSRNNTLSKSEVSVVLLSRVMEQVVHLNIVSKLSDTEKEKISDFLCKIPNLSIKCNILFDKQSVNNTLNDLNLKNISLKVNEYKIDDTTKTASIIQLLNKLTRMKRSPNEVPKTVNTNLIVQEKRNSFGTESIVGDSHHQSFNNGKSEIVGNKMDNHQTLNNRKLSRNVHPKQVNNSIGNNRTNGKRKQLFKSSCHTHKKDNKNFKCSGTSNNGRNRIIDSTQLPKYVAYESLTTPTILFATNIATEKITLSESSFNNLTEFSDYSHSSEAKFLDADKRGTRGRRQHRRRLKQQHNRDLSLWIDERQVKVLSGSYMQIYAIRGGHVLQYILDPDFGEHLPIIPSEVESVNFTWHSGSKKYEYRFDKLTSSDESILKAPILSIKVRGRIPKKSKVFTVHINCTGEASGVASFTVGLLIQTRHGKLLPGTPLQLKLRKECLKHGRYPECDEKCENGGICDANHRCQCKEGYLGPYCNTALCYPQCENGGTCTSPGKCTCLHGFQGRHCEGGLCREKCLNGGKCMQKDACSCPKGYFGNRCEYSKCVIPCVNGGRCKNVNKCRCPHGFEGHHCEIMITGHGVNKRQCDKRCRKGSCLDGWCRCNRGFTGRWCKNRTKMSVDKNLESAKASRSNKNI